jgi:hypothetical protein
MKHWVGTDIKVMKATGEDSKYVVGFYHYYTKHVKCYFIPSKAHFPTALEKYLQWYQTFRNHRLQFLTLDQAGKNISKEVQEIIDKWGIDLRKSTANNPYQNGMDSYPHAGSEVARRNGDLYFVFVTLILKPTFIVY